MRWHVARAMATAYGARGRGNSVRRGAATTAVAGGWAAAGLRAEHRRRGVELHRVRARMTASMNPSRRCRVEPSARGS
ncbi:hypothetical protein GQ55_2G105600 [Panicum hallii var. hallii]|nr:hypothetical protein GQ55_2G105600 [Panicum hallii var. hallii]